MRMDSSVDQMWRVKMEDLRLTRFRKCDTSPRLLDQGNIWFETLALGPLLVANWKPKFQEVWEDRSLCFSMSDVPAL